MLGLTQGRINFARSFESFNNVANVQDRVIILWLLCMAVIFSIYFMHFTIVVSFLLDLTQEKIELCEVI